MEFCKGIVFLKDGTCIKLFKLAAVPKKGNIIRTCSSDRDNSMQLEVEAIIFEDDSRVVEIQCKAPRKTKPKDLCNLGWELIK